METHIGIITEDGFVKLEDGRKFEISLRGTDSEGYPKVLIDATEVGGRGSFGSQSIKPFIGMKCWFVTNGTMHGFNFEILKPE